ncbi:MAG: UDP-N-acetylglucosamine 1-carboxyvinyltransferase [Deltaproteobacteria bacterium]|nr:UDP-N-acetylglucosamine 1-carboxyvinyltransferase [Deltaproteobacteria bacterium]
MYKILVEGGHRLKGEVRIGGAKNAALPILASALLVDGECVFENTPDLKDVKTFMKVMEHLGAKCRYENHVAVIDASACESKEAPYDLVRTMRASVLVIGPLVARCGRARVSLPGGCAIGARPIDLHLKGLEAMGATVSMEHGYVEVTAERLMGADIYLDMPTVTGTENLMMAAALAKGVTTLRNAAREPEIAALAEVLNLMGARVTGAGSEVVTITGVDALKPARYSIIPDRIETGTYMVAAALTKGDVTLTHVCPDHLSAVIHKLRQAGVTIETGADTIRVMGPETIKSVDLTTRPHPGFPTDMQAQFMVLMCVANSNSVINETIFENRFIHVSELKRLGADITVTGNTAVVRGVKRLLAAPVMASDLRASACLILAGLVAEGVTEVNRVYHLDRGYESIEKKLTGIGAVIRRVWED